jgi:hypothetical protein
MQLPDTEKTQERLERNVKEAFDDLKPIAEELIGKNGVMSFWHDETKEYPDPDRSRDEVWDEELRWIEQLFQHNFRSTRLLVESICERSGLEYERPSKNEVSSDNPYTAVEAEIIGEVAWLQHTNRLKECERRLGSD